MTITIYQIFEGGQRRALGKLEDDVVYIGREPQTGGITVESRSVSREHAVFIKVSSQWFYKDLGSSNGSWLNGAHVSAGVPYLLRINDSIQLADSIIKLTGETQSYQAAPEVIAFSRSDFLGVFPIPEVGKVVSVGGAKGDLKLDVDFGELPIVVVEKRSNFVCAYPVAPQKKAMINDHQLSQLVQLKDRDTISVPPYTLVLSIPNSDHLDSIGSENKIKSEELRETFTGWEDEQKPLGRSIFGQIGESISPKDRHDSEESSGNMVSDMRPGSRFEDPPAKPQNSINVIEERIVFVLGFLMVLTILGLVLWWLLG